MTSEESDSAALPGSGEGAPQGSPVSDAGPAGSGGGLALTDAVSSPPAETDAPPAADAAPGPGAPETGPVAVLAEALTVAAGSSKLLRRASIYIGLLMLALAGPGVVAGLALVGSAELFDPTADISEELAGEAGRAGLLIIIALVGAIIASVEGTAIGITLLAGRVVGRSMSLAAALERSRKVFWRILRAGFLIGLVTLGATVLWDLLTGKVTFEDLSGLTNEPLVAAIATLPFVWATVAIVLADDGARAALRRSVRIARRNRRLTVALAAFGLLAGVVQSFALGSGLDLIVRLTEALHLDITAGGLSFLLAGALALAVVMAAGSLLFTVTALVNAPQIVAWSRLGLPLDGLPLPVVAGSPAVVGPEPEAPAELALPSAEVEPAMPSQTGWGAPAAPVPSAWAIAAAKEQPFRWVTLPMRLTVLGMWLIAIVSLLTERAM